ncbi:VOC family protein [Gordonia soli]|uniref:Putative pterin-4-alpha-carbinolamine dehydratase n=1 Tax=Gordonia soli NBRC 108243 TaxID=1223545 RepID=M0QG31_9ACTN|nr:VOC family protein [Gordonia soli]GAC67585.1 hypothetical protein GS4_08_01700 [Gordonia soli NBRC 108243]
MTGSTGTPVTSAAATEAVSDPWRVLSNVLHATYRTGSMAAGGEFVTAVIGAAEEAGHHPDIDIRYPTVHLALSTHSAHRLTEADVALANRIAEIAVEHGLTPHEKHPPAVFELAIDALDIARIAPFWRAVLGYDEEPEHTSVDLSDPEGRLPGIYFQQMDEPRPQRSRMHVDLWVPHDVVHQRLQAALAADGQLLTDEFAPEWWVLADPEGNEVCLCTWQQRED